MNNSGVKLKRLKDPIVFVRLEKLIEYSHLQSQKYEFLIKNIELFELKDNRIGRINKVKGIERLIKRILDNSTHESPFFNFIIEAVLSGGISRTVGKGFLVNKTTDLEVLSNLITEYIEKFETQSGVAEERKPEEVYASLIRVIDRSDAPAVNWNDPLALPSSEKSPVTRKARSSRKNTEEKLAVINSKINTLSSELKSTIISTNRELIEAIKSSSQVSSSQTVSPLSSSINWTPIVQGLVSGLATSFVATTLKHSL
jgi:hypothetical protein